MMYSPFRHFPSVLLKSRPIQLTFFATRECNSRCPFCFYLRGKGPAGRTRAELSLEEVEKLSKSFDTLLWLLFSGGEVYLRRDIAEIAKVFYDDCKPAIITFPTNGLLPELIKESTEEILKHCKKSVVVVKLSLDGLYEEHDSLRNVEGNFRKVMQTYEMLSGLLENYPNFELGVNTVFCSKNQDKMKEIINFVNRLDKVRAHTLSMIRGDLEEESFKNIDLKLYKEAIDAMEKNLRSGEASIYGFKGARLKAAQDLLQRRLIYATMLRKRRLVPCYAGRLNLVLTESGDVYPCEILDKKMGNIRDHDCDMRQLLQSEEAKKIIREIETNDCYCSHECYFTTNILFNPRLYPALAREYMRLIL